MDLIGEFLKKCRKKRNISLLTISQQLNISIDFLEAIENDDFNKTPGGVYVIGYIRSYANFLDLDSNQIIDKYKTQISFSEVNILTELPKPIEAFYPFKSYKVISLIAFVSISFVFYSFFIDKTNNLPDYAMTTEVSPSQKSEIEEFELKNALSEIKKNKMLINNKEEQNNEFAKYSVTDINQDEKIIEDSNINNQNVNSVIASIQNDLDIQDITNLISIKVSGETWIQLRDNQDKIVYNKFMNKNDEYTYYLDENYMITTGNAGNIIVSIGGNFMGKLGKKGEILESIIITPDIFSN